MSALRKNVASQNVGFCLNAKADGTPVTAGGAGTVVIDGGAQAACAGTFTHKGTGQWNYVPTQAETNGSSISFAFTGTGAIQVGVQCWTIGYDPTLANVPANATQFAGQTITAGAGVTIPSSIASPTNITAATGITVATNSDKTGYALTSGERNSIADAMLDRDMSTGADSGSPSVRTVRQALRFLRNKWAVAAGTLTVFKEDDSTSSWTATVTTDAAALPIVTNDPA